MAQYQSFPGAIGDSRTFDKLKALRLPALAGRSFLDVGCNEGFFCGFAHFQGASRVVGVDHGEAFIRRARDRFPACEFRHGDWEHLPEGPFDIILLASALHYADDQPALIRALVDRLSEDGTLVLELGVVSSRKAEWTRVQRGIDERLFPSMPMLREVLADYAWKWIGPSISQDGDPVARHVVHISRRRPVAYLLMQPPGYGKSSIASRLFVPAGVQVVSGDEQIGLLARGKREASARLRAAVEEDYSPFNLDRTIERIFELGLGGELLALWLGQAGEGDVALDVYVPTRHHATMEQLLVGAGYLPVQLRWERIGSAPMPEAMLNAQAEAYYLSLAEGAPAGGAPAKRTGGGSGPAGFVDEISVSDGRVQIRGWAVDAGGALPGRLGVKVKRRTLYVDHLDKQLRPDVQRHLGLPHALVGYCISLDLPEVRAAADLGSGFSVFVPGGVVFQLAGPVADIFRPGR